jgi:proline iminopeptidase
MARVRSDRHPGPVLKALRLLVALATAMAAAVVAMPAVAWFTAEPVLFLGAGWSTAVVVWLSACRLSRSCPRRQQLIGVAGLSAILATGLVPLHDTVTPPATPPGAGRWSLPDGGSLAYGVVHAAAGAVAATPVVVVHGGPGVPDLNGVLTALAPLAADGHDVWAYAQRGSGNSSRLTDPRGYTIARAVEDLDQVRLQTGARQLILVGHSYGAFVVAAYLAAHPDHVAMVVFSSPGDLRLGGVGGSPQSRLDLGRRLQTYALLTSTRALLTYALVQVNSAAARAIAGDREVDARQDRVYAATEPAMHCPGHNGPALHGLGFYANQVPQSLRRPDVPDVGAALRGTRVPALVLKGECDYLSWESAVTYLDTFADSQLSYLPGAGHDAYVDRPDLYLTAVRAFVAGATVPGTLVDPRQPPHGYQP